MSEVPSKWRALFHLLRREQYATGMSNQPTGLSDDEPVPAQREHVLDRGRMHGSLDHNCDIHDGL